MLSLTVTDLGNIPEVTVDFILDRIVPNPEIEIERKICRFKRKFYSMLIEKNSLVHCPSSRLTPNGWFSEVGAICRGIIGSNFDDGFSRTPTSVLLTLLLYPKGPKQSIGIALSS